MRARSLLLLLALIVVTGCGGGKGGDDAAPAPSPTVADATAAKAEIATAWEAFFKGGGTVDAHIALLEDGEKFRAELTAFAKDPINAELSAKVTDVVVNGSKAAVTYNLLGKNGAALLSGANGEAVQVAGSWRVSKASYCQLVALQDPTATHPGCS
jgi:hypothetical protein